MVPPHGRLASFCALVMIESRGFNLTFTMSLSNGITSAFGFFHKIAAANNAAISMHRTFDVEPFRYPVAGECIDPEMSGKT